MISISTIESFTEDELSFVLWVVNKLYPASLEITPQLLRSYNYRFLAEKLLRAKDQVSEEGKPIYISVLNKLRIPIPDGYEQAKGAAICQ